MFLGSIAGLNRLCMTIISMIFGSYISFESKVKWAKQMYNFIDEDDETYKTKQIILNKLGQNDKAEDINDKFAD